MTTEEQAQGLWDWARFHELNSIAYRDEEEQWEYWDLERKLGLTPPRPPRRKEEISLAFIGDKWSEEIMKEFKRNSIFPYHANKKKNPR